MAAAGRVAIEAAATAEVVIAVAPEAEGPEEDREVT